MRYSSIFILATCIWTAFAQLKEARPAVVPTTTTSTGPGHLHDPPRCLQSRVSNDPTPDELRRYFKEVEDVSTACNMQSLQAGFFASNALHYNISEVAHINPGDLSVCPDSFNKIISYCMLRDTGEKYWGGTIIENGVNYSISNAIYPANPLKGLYLPVTSAISTTSTSHSTMTSKHTTSTKPAPSTVSTHTTSSSASTSATSSKTSSTYTTTISNTSSTKTTSGTHTTHSPNSSTSTNSKTTTSSLTSISSETTSHSAVSTVSPASTLPHTSSSTSTNSPTSTYTITSTNIHTSTSTSTLSRTSTSTTTTKTSQSTSSSTKSSSTKPLITSHGPTTTASTTPFDLIVTSTITSVAQTVSTQTISVSYSENSWITTSHDGNSSTIVPVFVGCPGCGGPGRGIVVWGIPPLPQISFQLPDFPRLPSFHFPCLPIPFIRSCTSPPQNDNKGKPGPPVGNEQPDDPNGTSKTTSKSTSKSSTTTSTKSECPRTATTTVSDCLVRCNTITQLPKNTQTCSTSCISTRTGCSITGTTSTTTAKDDSCSAQGRCASCLSPRPGATITDSPDAVERRAIAGRVTHYATLIKREKDQRVTKINQCSLTKAKQNPPASTPSYLAGGKLWVSDIAFKLTAPWSDLPRYYMTADDGCIATITKVKGIKFVDANQLDPKDQLEPNAKANLKTTTDHAYENGWLELFLTSIIEGGSDGNQFTETVLTCDQVNEIFFPECGENYLAAIYGALASERHPDFFIMSDYLNSGCKNFIFNPQKDPGKKLESVNLKRTWAKNTRTIIEKLEDLEKFTLGGLTVNIQGLMKAVQQTNDRIFSRFQDLDAYLKTNNPKVGGHDFGFADKYKKYMNNQAAKFNKGNAKIKALLVALNSDLALLNQDQVDVQGQPILDAQGNPTKEAQGFVQDDWNKWQTMYNAYNTKYGHSGHAAEYQITFDFAYVEKDTDTDTDEEQARLNRRAAACVISSSTTTTTTKLSTSMNSPKPVQSTTSLSTATATSSRSTVSTTTQRTTTTSSKAATGPMPNNPSPQPTTSTNPPTTTTTMTTTTMTTTTMTTYTTTTTDSSTIVAGLGPLPGQSTSISTIDQPAAGTPPPDPDDTAGDNTPPELPLPHQILAIKTTTQVT